MKAEDALAAAGHVHPAPWRSDFERRYARAIEGGRGFSSAAWDAYNLAFADAGPTRGWPEHRGPLVRL